MEQPLLLLIIPAFIVGFVLFWCLICLFIAGIGGWATLARQYRVIDAAAADGPRFYLQSGEMNGSRYKGALTLGATREGLFLAVLPLFRPGHPPLLIPWSRLGAFQAEKQFWMTAYTTTIAAGTGTVRLTLYDKRLADTLQASLQSTSGSISDGSSKRA